MYLIKKVNRLTIQPRWINPLLLSTFKITKLLT